MKQVLLCLILATAAAFGAGNQQPLKDFPLKDIDGKDTSLKAYAGKVLLIVNVASKCGNTPQYKDLEATYEKYKDQGFVILGFPCNDFGGQEPGTNAEVKTFCTSKYNVSFPMFDKVKVRGEPKHPLYEALTGKKGAFPGDVKWNFGKFLIGRDGKPIMRIEPSTKVEDPKVVAAIEKALAAK
jgi:glutathione peroxidase